MKIKNLLLYINSIITPIAVGYIIILKEKVVSLESALVIAKKEYARELLHSRALEDTLTIAKDQITQKSIELNGAITQGNIAINDLNFWFNPTTFLVAGTIVVGVLVFCYFGNVNILTSDTAKSFADNTNSVVEQQCSIVSKTVVKANENQTELIVNSFNKVLQNQLSVVNNLILDLQTEILKISSNEAFTSSVGANPEQFGLVSAEKAQKMSDIFESLLLQDTTLSSEVLQHSAAIIEGATKTAAIISKIGIG